MYSVVMMMAMTGAPEMPAFGGRRNGCEGGGRASAGCRGYDNGGCAGGRGGRGRRGRGCGGYDDGCGCSGYMSHNAGCGCCGQMNYQAANCGCGGYQAACNNCGQADCGGYGQPMPVPASTPAPPAMPPKDGKPTAMIAAPAALVVNLPADANLKINGVATTQVAGVRQFATPTLVAGQTFYYTLSAEVVRDGQTLTSTQTCTVRAGETTNVSLASDQFALTVAAR